MSKIIEKAFDATKKIIRSVFLGSPNLITSSDLNRQMEAFKYQLDQLDDKTGMISDINIMHNLSGSTFTVGWTVSYMKFKGCSFSINNPPLHEFLSINLTGSAPIAYMCLVADKRTVTYSDDTTHDLAGAKFEDGTSMPAANQIIYENEGIVLTHALSSIENLVGVVAVFTLSNTGNVIVRRNFIANEQMDTLAMGKSEVITDFNSKLKGTIANGKTYDEAFSILDGRFNNLSTNWLNFTRNNENSGVRYRIEGGGMMIQCIQELTLEKAVTGMGGCVIRIGDLTAPLKSSLISYFNSFGFDNYYGYSDNEIYFVPYGNIGVFPYIRTKDSTNDAIYGRAKLSLILSYTPGNPYTLTDIFLGCYVDSIIKFSSSGVPTFTEGPVDWLLLQGGTVKVPKFAATIPLPGKV